MKKQMFVVEGKNDVNKLRSIYKDINVVSVGGSQVDEKVVNYLNKIKETYEIIIITDPDYPGKQIRDYLEEKLVDVKHVFLEPKYSKSSNKKKIGLEHVSSEIIKRKLNDLITFKPNDNLLTNNDLINNKLIGFPNSKELRYKLTTYIKIDNCNGKRLLKRLNSLNIDKYKLKEIVNSF